MINAFEDKPLCRMEEVLKNRELAPTYPLLNIGRNPVSDNA